jgi:hypothetical protein
MLVTLEIEDHFPEETRLPPGILKNTSYQYLNRTVAYFGGEKNLQLLGEKNEQVFWTITVDPSKFARWGGSRTYYN